MNLKRWDERVARARRLAAEYPTAADLLTFYASLAEYQKSLIEKRSGGFSSPTDGKASRPLFEALDFGPVLTAIPDFLSWLQRAAPAPLKEAAGELRSLERSAWRHLIDSYLTSDGGAADSSGPPGGPDKARPTSLEDLKPVATFVVEAVLQPFAEHLARAQDGDAGAGPYSMARAALLGGPATERVRAHGAPYSSEGSRCTVCGGRAVVGVLREEGHGAKRTLVCGLCLTERDYLRVVCPGCGEQRFDALPVYTADQFDHVRIEACDSCRTYLKTIDLTKNGLAVPLVDDIASVTMDLWARDGGYTRLRPNLLRM